MALEPRSSGQKKILHLASRVALFGWFHPAQQYGLSCLSASAIEVSNLNLDDLLVTRLGVLWSAPGHGPMGLELDLNLCLEAGEMASLLDGARLPQLLRTGAGKSRRTSSLVLSEMLPILLSVDVVTHHDRPRLGEQLRLSVPLRLSWAQGQGPQFLIEPGLPAPTTTLLG